MSLYNKMQGKIIRNVLFMIGCVISGLAAKVLCEHNTFAFIATVSTVGCFVTCLIIYMRVYVNENLVNARAIENSVFRGLKLQCGHSVSYAEHVMCRLTRKHITGNHGNFESILCEMALFTKQELIDLKEINIVAYGACKHDDDTTMEIMYEHVFDYVRNEYIRIFGLQNCMKSKSFSDGLTAGEMDVLILRIISSRSSFDFFGQVIKNANGIFQCGSESMERINYEFEMYKKFHSDCNVIFDLTQMPKKRKKIKNFIFPHEESSDMMI